jgi:hypothetical protein
MYARHTTVDGINKSHWPRSAGRDAANHKVDDRPFKAVDHKVGDRLFKATDALSEPTLSSPVMFFALNGRSPTL